MTVNLGGSKRSLAAVPWILHGRGSSRCDCRCKTVQNHAVRRLNWLLNAWHGPAPCTKAAGQSSAGGKPGCTEQVYLLEAGELMLCVLAILLCPRKPAAHAPALKVCSARQQLLVEFRVAAGLRTSSAPVHTGNGHQRRQGSETPARPRKPFGTPADWPVHTRPSCLSQAAAA